MTGGFETLVAAAVMAQVARKITDYGEEEIKLCCDFNDDLNDMKRVLSHLGPQLTDAEKNSFGRECERVREWLGQMKSLAYDIEDMLDEYYYDEDEQLESCCCCAACTRKAPLLCSMTMSNPMLTRICMIHKMKSKRTMLQMERQTPSLGGFSEHINSAGNFTEEETSSHANTELIGRDKDLENIMAKIRVEGCSIITILGPVGLGKTRLVQEIYNHDETTKIFQQKKMWIHVPMGKATREYIGRRIILHNGEAVREDTPLQATIAGVHAILSGDDKYLIVLDSLWSINEKILKELKEMIMNCRNNIKVIVTTHSQKVAELMSTLDSSYMLAALPEDDILTIFAQKAMASSAEVKALRRHPLFDEMLTKYEKKIIERCEGLPLVANFLGSVVNAGKESTSWDHYWAPASTEEMWKVEEDFVDDKCNISPFLPSLKPIYYNMKNELRLCFVYFSIFPKGSVIDKKRLVKQWIALNMIEPSRHGNLPREETAEDYIDRLRALHFLQISTSSSPANEEMLRVHTLAYELARSVGSDDILVISDATTKEEAQRISWRHDYRYAQLSTSVSWFEGFNDWPRKARSLILKSSASEVELVRKMILQNKYLRVLDLRRCCITELPECIFWLKQLRYLDVSGLPITVLSPELSNLTKLATLDVSETKLTWLPVSVSKLKKLDYLNLNGCRELQHLHGLDNLDSLEDLILSGLHLQEVPDTFAKFTSLQYLNLSSCSKLQKLPTSLFQLQNLKGLDLSSCWDIKELTESFGNLNSLKFLNLSDCTSLGLLPTSFGGLANLEDINLSLCTALKELPESFCTLRKARILRLSGCEHLISQVRRLPINLEHLELSSCQGVQLISDLFIYLTRLRELDLSNCLRVDIDVKTKANLEVLFLSNSVLPGTFDFLTMFDKLQKLDIRDARLVPNTSLHSLQRIFSCMPMLHTVETNNKDVISILPQWTKRPQLMDAITRLDSSSAENRGSTSRRQIPIDTTEGPGSSSTAFHPGAGRSSINVQSSVDGPDLIRQTAVISEDIYEEAVSTDHSGAEGINQIGISRSITREISEDISEENLNNHSIAEGPNLMRSSHPSATQNREATNFVSIKMEGEGRSGTIFLPGAGGSSTNIHSSVDGMHLIGQTVEISKDISEEAVSIDHSGGEGINQIVLSRSTTREISEDVSEENLSKHSVAEGLNLMEPSHSSTTENLFDKADNRDHLGAGAEGLDRPGSTCSRTLEIYEETREKDRRREHSHTEGQDLPGHSNSSEEHISDDMSKKEVNRFSSSVDGQHTIETTGSSIGEISEEISKEVTNGDQTSNSQSEAPKVKKQTSNSQPGATKVDALEDNTKVAQDLILVAKQNGTITIQT